MWNAGGADAFSATEGANEVVIVIVGQGLDEDLHCRASGSRLRTSPVDVVCLSSLLFLHCINERQALQQQGQRPALHKFCVKNRKNNKNPIKFAVF